MRSPQRMPTGCRMMRAVRAEWTKLRSVRSTAWLLAATVGFTVLVAVAAIAAVDPDRCPPGGCPDDLTKVSLTGVWLGQAAVIVLAVLAVTNEYGTGMIHTTLTAIPRRAAVFAAKAAVVTGVVLPSAALAVLGSLIAGHPEVSLTDPPTVRAAIGTALYFGLIALLGLGIGVIVRDTAGALTAALGLVYGAPVVAALVTDPRWHDRLEKLSPTAGFAVQATRHLDELPIGPWAGLAVSAGYAGAALLLGLLLFRVRDA